MLPLSKSVRTLAVIGPLADHRRAMLGNWAVAGREEDAITPLEGLKAALGDQTRLIVAKGADIETAARNAKAWISGAIAAADRFTVGHGHGPIHHFYGINPA